MAKWFVYIVFSLMLIPWLSTAKIHHPAIHKANFLHDKYRLRFDSAEHMLADTTPKKQNDDKKKIKEVNKAKPVPKPGKVDDNTQKPKPKRQRRPPGMERPPEIPRHNGD
jgi:hypothetical protein